MAEELVKSEATFGIHLDGESQIDAELLSKMIHDMAELTRLAAKEENPQAYLKMNVTAFKNGSFQIDFSAVCEAAKTFFLTASAGAGLASVVIGTVKGFLETKKLLKGEKPKNVKEKGPQIEIENSTGEKVQVNKSSQAILHDCQIDQLTMNLSIYMMGHNPDGGFEFVSGKEKVRFGPDDVKVISKPMSIEEETICKRSRVEAELIIRKAALVGRSAWDFIYKGKTISASILDDEWISEVNSGDVAMRSGDYILATLEIYVDLNSDGKPIEKSEKYTVIKVQGGIRHLNEFPQQKL